MYDLWKKKEEKEINYVSSVVLGELKDSQGT